MSNEHERFYKTIPMVGTIPVGTIPENSRGGGGTGLQPVVCGKVAAAGTDRIGGAGVVMHTVVVDAQSNALREENERLREHLISALDTLKDAEVCDDNCGPCNEARAELGESK
jgi:hypothetical protein